MNLRGLQFTFSRITRNAKQLFEYRLRSQRKPGTPDNHYYKRKRIIRIKEEYQCTTLIETGTFYGQMTHAMAGIFEKVISIEISSKLAIGNQKQFQAYPNITILHGDSSQLLSQAIALSSGKILFWLDGHYSGKGTGIGQEISPILRELDAIAISGITEYCLIIDDRRLFENGTDYPEVGILLNKLRELSPTYEVVYDRDALIFGNFNMELNVQN